MEASFFLFNSNLQFHGQRSWIRACGNCFHVALFVTFHLAVSAFIALFTRTPWYGAMANVTVQSATVG